MRNQEETYSNTRVFESSSESQNPVIHEEIQGPREVGQKGVFNLLTSHCSGSWDPLLTFDDGNFSVADIHIILQCFGLESQCKEYFLQNRQELQKNQNNINQRYSTMQNNSCLNETLRNKPTECDGFKSQEEQISGETNINRERPNRFCGENKIVLECKQHTGKCVEAQWFCCGIKCYFFIMDDKQWTGCKQTCEACSLSLLKIHDYDELVL
ncbi:killer cell lectin-like receptor [Cricetulus griseus]|uniref:Killer cell lectin-like receptor n=1 Tax=Cricetulus griseus TaxID=10029 RepID=A0A061I2A4_CRIGR|nr:killer cell lectin-like receptor [Cricetulus griseus]